MRRPDNTKNQRDRRVGSLEKTHKHWPREEDNPEACDWGLTYLWVLSSWVRCAAPHTVRCTPLFLCLCSVLAVGIVFSYSWEEIWSEKSSSFTIKWCKYSKEKPLQSCQTSSEYAGAEGTPHILIRAKPYRQGRIVRQRPPTTDH